MKEITVVARATAQKGKEKELENAFRSIIGPTHNEKGCILYVVNKGIEDPRQFVVVERWASVEDHESHMKTPHIQELFKKVPHLVSSEPEVLRYEIIKEGSDSKGSF